MALVIKGDLANVNNSLNVMSGIISSNNQVISQLNAFCANSVNQLKGGGYDAVRAKLRVYIDAFTKQNTILQVLKSNMTSANNSLSNYMEEYSSLDDSRIGEVRQALNMAEEALSFLKSQIGKNNFPGLSGLIALCESEIERLKKLLRLLEGLAGADAKSYGMISGVESDTNNYALAINNLTPTSFDTQI